MPTQHFNSRNMLRAIAAAAVLPLACYSGDVAETGNGTDQSTESGENPTSVGSDPIPTTGGTDDPEETTGDTDDDDTTGDPADCYSTRDFFVDKVWAPMMSMSCVQCHDPTGIAAEKGAKFQLLSAVYPGFIETNLEHIKSLAGYEYAGEPLMLAKPTGKVDHAGGIVLSEDSELYDNLAELLVQLDDPIECPTAPPGAAFPDVTMLTPSETLRKAALHLLGRLPTAEEEAAVADGGEPALAAALDAFMLEDAFYERLAELFNDTFFTDFYIPGNRAVQTLQSGTPDFPNVTKYFDTENPIPADQKLRVARAVAREPLLLLQYIVRNELPFTDIVLANYTVFTPDSAWLYGVDARFNNPDDPNELQPGVLKVTRNGNEMPFPHAGILTSPMWLNRFPTTPTNRNRHRASMIYDQFLATDVLALASQAIDPAAGSDFANATRDAPECAKCHRTIDPIAGGFQMFNQNNQEYLLEKPAWFAEMFAPGWGNELMPTSEFPTAVQWIAKRVASDPRFALSATYHVLSGLTGHRPLAYPTNTQDPNFKQLLVAWEVQDQFLRAAADNFVQANYNLKVVFREIIMGPYYRAKNLAQAPNAIRRAELSQVGTGRLSTPELLNRKVLAITGVRWRTSFTAADLLLTDFNILYGGIDSFDITQRLGDINQVMASITSRMAVQVGCVATAYDFTKLPEDRLLFPMVEFDSTPELDEQAIRNNIAYLHYRILGETVAPDSQTVDATYKLYTDTWEQGVANLADETESASLGSCQATRNPLTNEDLPEEDRITTDPTYGIRAWQAVIIYLLSDFNFLYE